MKETNPEYLIHEDYSINMEEISKRLAEIHKTYIPKDDPIMMIVSSAEIGRASCRERV